MNSPNYRRKYWHQLSQNSTKELMAYYSDVNPKIGTDDNTCIIMFDGKLKHGGLCDRLWGIVSAFQFCSKYNIDFKLLFNHPFCLNDYLLPNKVAWDIDANDISYNTEEAAPLTIWSYYNINQKGNKPDCLKEILKIKQPQIHLYTNAHSKLKDFNNTFWHLFKISDSLNIKIKQVIDEIGQPFISLSFRFQNSLGDFSDYKSDALPHLQQSELIKKCLECVNNLCKKYPDYKILVTADSQRFLDSLPENSQLFVISGKLGHPDYHEGNFDDINLKMFLDFFVISKAQHVFLAIGENLYNSSFARTASLVGNTKFSTIKI